MGDRGFPGQVRIVHDLAGHPVIVALAEPGRDGGAILLQQLSGRDVVITGGTEAVAELELVQPAVGIVHPGLVGDGPGSRRGREVTPAVTAGELGGAVGAERAADGIAVLVVVVHAAEEGEQLVVRIIVVVHRGGRTGGKEIPGHGSVVGGIEAIHHDGQEVRLGDRHFLTEEEGQVVVLTENVGEAVIQGVRIAILGAERFLVLIGHAGLVGGVVRDIVGRHAIEAVVGLVVLLQAALDLEVEVVDDLPVEGCIRIPGGTDTAGIVIGHRKERRRVIAIILLFVHAFQGGGERNRCIGDRMLQTTVSGGGSGIVDAVGAGTADIHAGITDVGVDAGGFGGLEIRLEIQVVAGIGGTGHDGLVAHVGIAEGPVHIVTAARDGEVGGEGITHVAEDRIDPIVTFQAFVQVDIGKVAEVRLVIGAEVVADDTEFVLELHEVLRIHRDDGAGVGHFLETVVRVELHGDPLSLFGTLGGHDDDTVRTAASVDGRGEGVLQDVDGLDLGGRDVVDGLHREAVHDVERAAVLGNGAAATDADLDISVRIAFRRDDGDARHLSGKSLGNSGHRLFGELVGTDGSDGAEEVTALDRLVTHDDHFVEEGRVHL